MTMPEVPTPHTPETRAAAYKAALEAELAGARMKARGGQHPDGQAAADQCVKDVEAELSRVTGRAGKA
jgi:hypothetical protein